MTESITPIKRSVFLAGLSREHHESLLFSWKIKQGLHYKVEPSRMLEFCNWYFAIHIKEHFDKEETSLTKVLPNNHLMMRKMIDDHDAIRSIMKEMNVSVTEALLLDLANTVKDHVRFEERQLFNYIEEIATAAQLKMLGIELAEQISLEPQWTDEFWLAPKREK